MEEVVDAIFSLPRLAEVYDAIDGDRDDLDHYEAMVHEFGAQSVLDIGCGTGTFACRIARAGVEVIAVDPAAASLAVARRKSGADAVQWIEGDATSPALAAMQSRVDLVVMTGNVAQVFVVDADWSATLRAVRGVVHPEGRFVFEVRDPARRAWEQWNRADSFRRVELSVDEAGAGGDSAVRRLESWVDHWVELVHVSPPLVTFRSVHRFESDRVTLSSMSVLRFRERVEIDASLSDAGFAVEGVRDAPDRPGMEWVVVARPVG